ncbi:hypothetical protein ACJZ2D_015858 [Fusarium nematophilum]
MFERSFAMGKEFKSKGANIALAPAAGPLGRSAYSGRNWEGFSPDPYLSGIGVEESVKGLQDAGVQATAKHCILNEQEGNRNPKTVNGTSYSSISTNADDRTVLHSGLASLAAGLDLEMPGHLNFGALLTGLPGQPLPAWFGGIVTMGVNNGTIDTERLDDMVTRFLGSVSTRAIRGYELRKSWASENYDRYVLDLDWQGNELVDYVASICSNTIVVTHSSGINILPFADHPNVTAILSAYYSGQEPLRGFDKLTLAPGEEGKATFDLMRRDLSYWDVVEQQWTIPRGDFTLSAGWSSRNLVETAILNAVTTTRCAKREG